jgi:hypothetical protein
LKLGLMGCPAGVTRTSRSCVIGGSITEGGWSIFYWLVIAGSSEELILADLNLVLAFGTVLHQTVRLTSHTCASSRSDR